MALLDQTARELLDLFAAGKNTPGAGSAAALMGALAGSLLQAVATYTSNAAEKRSDPTARARSEAVLEEARERSERLRAAIDEDAAAFNRYWEQRTSEALQRATEIPIAISTDCLALTELGIELYDTGFRNARAEANGAALAALAGGEAALLAALINLKAAGTSSWAESAFREADLLRERLSSLRRHMLQSQALL
jgi:formiminotetrahydrofolate cyclodeaminase